MTAAKRPPAARIQSVEAARRAAAAHGAVTFWVTRDMWCGKVSDRARVWLREPKFTSYRFESVMSGTRGRCVTWSAAFEGGEDSALYCEWTLEICAKVVGTIPDDERQAVRKEGPAGLAVGPIAWRSGPP